MSKIGIIIFAVIVISVISLVIIKYWESISGKVPGIENWIDLAKNIVR